MGSRPADQGPAAGAAEDSGRETEAQAWVKTATWAEVIDMLAKSGAYFLHMAELQTDTSASATLRGCSQIAHQLESRATIEHQQAQVTN